MARNAFILAAIVLVSACGSSATAPTSTSTTPANIAGTWTGSAGTGGVFMPVTMTLAQTGTSVSGTISVGGRTDLSGPIKGTVQGELLNLTLPAVRLGQMMVKQQNTITGEVAGGMPVTLRRAQ